MPTALTDTDSWTTAPDGPATGEPRTSALIRSYMGKINNRVRWVFNRLATNLFGSFQLITNVDTATEYLTIAGHGLASNTAVRVESVGGSVPTGLSATTVYYVIVVDADTIQLSASSGPGAAVDITSTGTGTLYLYTVVDAATKLFTLADGTLPTGTITAKLQYLRDNYGAKALANTWALAQTFSSGITLSGLHRVTYAARTIIRQRAFNASSTSANWERAATPKGAWQNTASGGTLDIPLEGLPHGNVLQSVVLRWQGAGGHGALPTMPSIELFKVNFDGTQTSLGSQADTAADVTAYEAVHSISLTGLSETIDYGTARYVLTVTGETGANFVANAKTWMVFCSCEVTTQTEY